MPIPLLLQVKELFETTDINEANERLRNGWKLLDTYSSKNGFTYLLCLV